MTAREYNFDGLVGPTHNYAGLSYGNVASQKNQNLIARPKAAALQGLEKMKAVADMGIGQAILPPLHRPMHTLLRQLGFSGLRSDMISQCFQEDPVLLACVYSASNMWTANAATVSPSPDCGDGRMHLTIANLASGLHRFIEQTATHRVLSSIFANDTVFKVHPPLPSAMTLSDEGAANHTRLCGDFAKPGLEVFVWGRSGLNSSAAAPKKFPARQTLEASQAVVRRHGLDPRRAVFVQQNPEAIDAGVFHNDVISVGNANVLLCHEKAFVGQQQFLDETRKKFMETCGGELHVCELSESDISMSECVASYLFNSQILTRPDGRMVLLCPSECKELESARKSIDHIIERVEPIDSVRYMDLRQSMQNGGGPACLRLRICMTDQQVAAMHPGFLFNENLYERLVQWVTRHYRETLSVADLADPALPIEIDAAFIALADILDVPVEVFMGPESK